MRWITLRSPGVTRMCPDTGGPGVDGEHFPAVRRRFHTFHAAGRHEPVGGEHHAAATSGQRPQPGAAPAFAEELRILRTGRKLSLRQLGERVGWDWSLFGKMEKGETLGSPDVVQGLDTFYETPGLLLALWELAAGDKSQFKERYRRYMTLESEAVCLWHFGVSVVPGLLQTPEYARELLAAGGYKGKELEQQVEARMSRKALLEGRTRHRSERSWRRRSCVRQCGTGKSGARSWSTCWRCPSGRTSLCMSCRKVRECTGWWAQRRCFCASRTAALWPIRRTPTAANSSRKAR